MFRAIILPIFRSTRLCVTACGVMHPQCCWPVAWSMDAELLRFQANGPQHCVCIIPQAVTHSLVLLKVGKVIVRNMLSWLELLINRYCCIYIVVFIIYSPTVIKEILQIMRNLKKNPQSFAITNRMNPVHDSHPIYWKTILILVSHHRLDIPSNVITSFSFPHRNSVCISQGSNICNFALQPQPSNIWW